MAGLIGKQPQKLGLQRVMTRRPEQTGQRHFSVCANRRNQVQMNRRLREVPARKSHNPLPDFHA